MAVSYDHYKGVEPGSITTATGSLRAKVQTSKSKLGTLKGSLSDDIWKASAKATLLTAFDKIDGEVCQDILDKLDTADEIAGYITDYNTAKAAALGYKSDISNAKEGEDTSGYEAKLAAEEKKMQSAVDSINGLL